MKIADCIITMLAERNTSKSKLAFDLGVSRQLMNTWVNGKKTGGKTYRIGMTVNTSIDIAHALGYSFALIPTDKVPSCAVVLDERTNERKTHESR